MLSTCPLIPKSSSFFTKPLRIVPNTPITNGITVTFMFYRFFSLPAKSRYLSFCLILFLLCDLLGHQNPIFSRFSFFCWLSQSLVIWLRFGDLFVSQIQENFVHLVLQDRFWIVHILLVHMVKFKFPLQSQWITYPT